MSKQHPVVAVTGSSGAGTTTVKTAFEHIFRRLDVTAAVIEGDSFHRYSRAAMRAAISDAASRGDNISHFGPDANLLCELGKLFKEYGETGRGKRRFYVHNEDEAVERGVKVVIATGRAPRNTLPIYNALGLDTPIIAHNGAMIYDPATDTWTPTEDESGAPSPRRNHDSRENTSSSPANIRSRLSNSSSRSAGRSTIAEIGARRKSSSLM